MTRTTLPLAVLLTLAQPLAADDGALVDYARQIKPIFKARCYSCHGALRQEGGLRLDTGASMRRGGDSGSAVDKNGNFVGLLFAGSDVNTIVCKAQYILTPLKITV